MRVEESAAEFAAVKPVKEAPSIDRLLAERAEVLERRAARRVKRSSKEARQEAWGALLRLGREARAVRGPGESLMSLMSSMREEFGFGLPSEEELAAERERGRQAEERAREAGVSISGRRRAQRWYTGLSGFHVATSCRSAIEAVEEEAVKFSEVREAIDAVIRERVDERGLEAFRAGFAWAEGTPYRPPTVRTRPAYSGPGRHGKRAAFDEGAECANELKVKMDAVRMRLTLDDLDSMCVPEEVNPLDLGEADVWDGYDDILAAHDAVEESMRVAAIAAREVAKTQSNGYQQQAHVRVRGMGPGSHRWAVDGCRCAGGRRSARAVGSRGFGVGGEVRGHADDGGPGLRSVA